MNTRRFSFPVPIVDRAGRLFDPAQGWYYDSYQGDLRGFLDYPSVGLSIARMEYRVPSSNLPHIKTFTPAEQSSPVRSPGRYDGVILVAYCGLSQLTVTFMPKTGQILIVPPDDFQIQQIDLNLLTQLTVPDTEPAATEAQ